MPRSSARRMSTPVDFSAHGDMLMNALCTSFAADQKIPVVLA